MKFYYIRIGEKSTQDTIEISGHEFKIKEHLDYLLTDGLASAITCQYVLPCSTR